MLSITRNKHFNKRSKRVKIIVEVLYMKNLKQLRSESGISQSKLAEYVDSTQQAIHRYEHEDYEPDIATMIQLADFFNTSVDFLIGNTEIRNRIVKIEKHDLTGEESAFIDKFRKLSAAQRKGVDVMLDTLLGENPPQISRSRGR
jgi:DNA-binding XRE family transcriptional regulator